MTNGRKYSTTAYSPRGFRDEPFLSSERRLTKGDSVKMPTTTTQWEPTVTNLIGLIVLEFAALGLFTYLVRKVS